MNCTEARPLLQARLDHELDAANSLRLEAHLKSCATCAMENKSFQSLSAALRDGNLRFVAPNSLKQDVRQFSREMRVREEKKAFGSQWIWKALTFAAIGFAVLTIWLRPVGLAERGDLLDEAVASHVRSLQVGHLMDVASSDQHTVKPWFNGKLDFAPNVKDFAEQGFPLVGGRLDYLDGRNVAALIYRRNKHFINVFIWPATSTKKIEVVRRRGFSVVTVSTSGMRYCLVSDLNEKELRTLAEMVAQ
jgi:anti-sigma factor RsiW